MYKPSLIEKLKKRDQLNGVKYIIKEFEARGEKGDIKPKYEEQVTGLDQAINRAVEITNIAFNGKKMTVLEIKRLRETMKYDLIGWRLEIVRVK